MSTFADKLLSVSVMVSMLLPLYASAQDSPDGSRMGAIEVTLVSDGWTFDEAAYKEMKTYIGSLITESRLDRYIVRGYGFEGGEAFCIQPRLRTYVPAIMKRLDQIRSAGGTTYTRRLVRECTIEK